MSTYVTEDGASSYCTEDGSAYYVTEDHANTPASLHVTISVTETLVLPPGTYHFDITPTPPSPPTGLIVTPI